MTKLLIFLAWLISLSPNAAAYPADGSCYKQCQAEYYQCFEVCQDGDMDCLDGCYEHNVKCTLGCNKH